MQKLFAKSSSDSASKFKFLAFVEAHQQRTKILTRPFRVGVSANDEFLLSMELNLDPNSGSVASL
jgi:hypothetical protein